jgi:glycosyltransferase involved in cell wall biosynthesis
MRHDFEQVEFSVVIPTFRRNRELAEAIASVQRQQGVTLEILVVDDCPTGGARTVVEDLNDPRVTYLRNPKPTGGIPSVVRNLAWPRASGRFVHFLDDDDMVPDGHYAAVAATFADHPEVGLVFGRVEPFGAGPESQLQHERQFFARASQSAMLCMRFDRKRALAGQMLFDMPLLVCGAAVVRRECVSGVAGFDPNIRLMEDADFNARVMRKYGACFVDQAALHYRIGYPSLMHSPNPPPAQHEMQCEGRRRMRAKYRQEHGAIDFYTLALFTRAMRIVKYLINFATTDTRINGDARSLSAAGMTSRLSQESAPDAGRATRRTRDDTVPANAR